MSSIKGSVNLLEVNSSRVGMTANFYLLDDAGRTRVSDPGPSVALMFLQSRRNRWLSAVNLVESSIE